MVELQRQLEEAGGTLATRSRVVAGSVGGGGLKRLVVEDVGSGGQTAVTARLVVNAAGLHAQRVSSLLEGLPSATVPALHLAKGSYFSLSGGRAGDFGASWLGRRPAAAPCRWAIIDS